MRVNNILSIAAVSLLAALMILALPRTRAIAQRDAHVLAVLTRVVPDEASVSYSVGGRVLQSMPLHAGTYRITVEELR